MLFTRFLVAHKWNLRAHLTIHAHAIVHTHIVYAHRDRLVWSDININSDCLYSEIWFLDYPVPTNHYPLLTTDLPLPTCHNSDKPINEQLLVDIYKSFGSIRLLRLRATLYLNNNEFHYNLTGLVQI